MSAPAHQPTGLAQASVPAPTAAADTTSESAQVPAAADNTELRSRLDMWLRLAAKRGFRVDGITLAQELLSEAQFSRLENELLNEKALDAFSALARRIEFISDAIPPPRLLQEPSLKSEVIYRQEIDYDICKSCRLCIQVCPKEVYVDDGFGRPDRNRRRPQECTGPHQCGQCVDICPENIIGLVSAEPVFEATIFVLLPTPEYGFIDKDMSQARDFAVANPLTSPIPVMLEKKLPAGKRLLASNERLDSAGFHPLLETHGYPRQFVDSPNPERDLAIWAEENGRDPELTRKAVNLLYKQIFQLKSLLRGKYHLGEIIHRIIDEIIHREIEIRTSGGRELLANIVTEAYVSERFLGAKNRPIGGILPTGTSVAWKTPYGEEIPNYVHLEKCLGPECGLCVTQCPEGGGGDTAAIRMSFNVPKGTVPTLVRGGHAYLLRVDGSHAVQGDYEDLSDKTPFQFVVNPDYCKSCGLCISCCPHDVIEPSIRAFDLRRKGL